MDVAVPEFVEAIDDLCGDHSVGCGTYAKYSEGSGLWLGLTTFSYFDSPRTLNFCLALHADGEDSEPKFQGCGGSPCGVHSGCMGCSDIGDGSEFFGLCKGYATEAKTATETSATLSATAKDTAKVDGAVRRALHETSTADAAT